jgi:translation initiation factor IF-1
MGSLERNIRFPITADKKVIWILQEDVIKFNQTPTFLTFPRHTEK